MIPDRRLQLPFVNQTRRVAGEHARGLDAGQAPRSLINVEERLAGGDLPRRVGLATGSGGLRSPPRPPPVTGRPIPGPRPEGGTARSCAAIPVPKSRARLNSTGSTLWTLRSTAGMAHLQRQKWHEVRGRFGVKGQGFWRRDGRNRTSDALDLDAKTGGRRQAGVSGHEGLTEGRGEHDIGCVVGGQVVPPLPDRVEQVRV